MQACNAMQAMLLMPSTGSGPRRRNLPNPPSAATLRYDAPLLCISSFAGQKLA